MFGQRSQESTNPYQDKMDWYGHFLITCSYLTWCMMHDAISWWCSDTCIFDVLKENFQAIKWQRLKQKSLSKSIKQKEAQQSKMTHKYPASLVESTIHKYIHDYQDYSKEKDSTNKNRNTYFNWTTLICIKYGVHVFDARTNFQPLCIRCTCNSFWSSV